MRNRATTTDFLIRQNIRTAKQVYPGVSKIAYSNLEGSDF